jgi:hypothetical protein
MVCVRTHSSSHFCQGLYKIECAKKVNVARSDISTVLVVHSFVNFRILIGTTIFRRYKQRLFVLVTM